MGRGGELLCLSFLLRYMLYNTDISGKVDPDRVQISCGCNTEYLGEVTKAMTSELPPPRHTGSCFVLFFCAGVFTFSCGRVRLGVSVPG